MTNLATAKIFMNGRSQAVRLPKEFRFDTEEVTVERQADGAVVLRPLKESHEQWAARLHTILAGMEDLDFVEREPLPAVDDIESLD